MSARPPMTGEWGLHTATPDNVASIYGQIGILLLSSDSYLAHGQI